MTSFTSFHGDGISIPLFHNLWKKDKSNKLLLNIPDTIVYILGHASGKFVSTQSKRTKSLF